VFIAAENKFQQQEHQQRLIENWLGTHLSDKGIKRQLNKENQRARARDRAKGRDQGMAPEEQHKEHLRFAAAMGRLQGGK
jgi:hypothetical protein